MHMHTGTSTLLGDSHFAYLSLWDPIVPSLRLIMTVTIMITVYISWRFVVIILLSLLMTFFNTCITSICTAGDIDSPQFATLQLYETYSNCGEILSQDTFSQILQKIHVNVKSCRLI